MLTAIAVPVGVAALAVGLEAAAFKRPPRDALVATDAIRGLLRYHVMRARESVDGERVRSTCIQGWFRPAPHRVPEPGALVLLSDGVKLYDFGRGVRRLGRPGPASRRDLARFWLAACPRYVAGHIARQLLNSRWVDTDPTRIGTAQALELSFGRPRTPFELYLKQPSLHPIEMRLTGDPSSGRSNLTPGGGAARPAARAR